MSTNMNVSITDPNGTTIKTPATSNGNGAPITVAIPGQQGGIGPTGPVGPTGPQGATGVIGATGMEGIEVSDQAPANTDILWADTTEDGSGYVVTTSAPLVLSDDNLSLTLGSGLSVVSNALVGQKIHYGSATPDSGIGVVGDYYLSTGLPWIHGWVDWVANEYVELNRNASVPTTSHRVEIGFTNYNNNVVYIYWGIDKNSWSPQIGIYPDTFVIDDNVGAQVQFNLGNGPGGRYIYGNGYHEFAGEFDVSTPGYVTYSAYHRGASAGPWTLIGTEGPRAGTHQEAVGAPFLVSEPNTFTRIHKLLGYIDGQLDYGFGPDQLSEGMGTSSIPDAISGTWSLPWDKNVAPNDTYLYGPKAQDGWRDKVEINKAWTYTRSENLYIPNSNASTFLSATTDNLRGPHTTFNHRVDANTVYFIPFFTSFSQGIMGCSVEVTGTAAGLMSMSLHEISVDGVVSYPGVQTVSLGEVNVSTTGQKTINLSPWVTLHKGKYALSFVCSSTPTLKMWAYEAKDLGARGSYTKGKTYSHPIGNLQYFNNGSADGVGYVHFSSTPPFGLCSPITFSWTTGNDAFSDAP